MVERAAAFFIDALPQVALRWASRSFIRGLLEAVLDEVPDPYELTSCLVNADRRADALVAKLEKVQALAEDTNTALEHTALQDILDGEP